MSREIKFRVWDEDNNTIGTVLSFTNLENLRHDLDGIEDYFGRGYFKDNPNYLMQFTGLKDKNGVDIYEGDLLEFPQFNAGVVKIETSGVCAVGFECFISNKSFHICKVIGNIHENKS